MPLGPVKPVLNPTFERPVFERWIRYCFLVTTLSLAGTALNASSPLLSLSASLSAKKKIDRINSGHLHSGEKIVLSETEVNSFLKYNYSKRMPEGVHSVRVKFQESSVVVNALVDFSRSQDLDKLPGFTLWKFLFDGEREITANCGYRSADGYGSLYLKSVEIDGKTIPQLIIDWLITSYVNPQIPNFTLGKKVDFPENIRHIHTEIGRAIVVAY